MVRRLKRKRLSRVPVSVGLMRPNQEWVLDFVSDSLATGRGIQVLASWTHLRAKTFLRNGYKFVEASGDAVAGGGSGTSGKPLSNSLCNGPEPTSRHFLSWCEERKIHVIHIQPGRPMQNRHVESFKDRLRDEWSECELVSDSHGCQGQDQRAECVQSRTAPRSLGYGRLRSLPRC
jgi:putative transposase